MIFSNQNLEAEERNMQFGTIYQVAMGEYGRGRHLMALTCPKGTELEKGFNEKYTITETKSGKPRISRGEDNNIYMMLSAQGGYTRRGDGVIYIPERDKDDFSLLAKGNGADGMAGRIGFWECALLKAPDHDSIVRVRTSGAGYGTPSDLYILHDGGIYECTLDTLDECCEALNIDIPCEVRTNEYGESVFGDDWTRACYLDIVPVHEAEQKRGRGPGDDTQADDMEL